MEEKEFVQKCLCKSEDTDFVKIEYRHRGFFTFVYQCNSCQRKFYVLKVPNQYGYQYVDSMYA